MSAIVKKRIKSFYEKFISLKGEPRHIALGMAVGVFIGVTPTIPFHTVLIILIGFVYRHNFTSAYLGSWLISNPLTIPVFYLSQYELGRVLLGMDHITFAMADYSFKTVASLGWQILLPLQAGGIIMAPFFAIPAYYICHRAVVAMRSKNSQ